MDYTEMTVTQLIHELIEEAERNAHQPVTSYNCSLVVAELLARGAGCFYELGVFLQEDTTRTIYGARSGECIVLLKVLEQLTSQLTESCGLVAPYLHTSYSHQSFSVWADFCLNNALSSVEC